MPKYWFHLLLRKGHVLVISGAASSTDKTRCHLFLLNMYMQCNMVHTDKFVAAPETILLSFPSPPSAGLVCICIFFWAKENFQMI